MQVLRAPPERESDGMTDLVTHSRTELRGLGTTERTLRESVDSGKLIRIRPGHFIEAESWQGAHSEQREIAAAHTAQFAARGEHVFSHTTAAALHGLPLFRHAPHRPHVMVGDGRAIGAAPAVFRHHDRWDGDSGIRDGLRVTTLARTVFDVIRTTRPETAISCADAALRRVSLRDDRGIDGTRAEALRESVLRLVMRAPGRRGIRQARETIAMADPRAESPGESVSRMYLLRLGRGPVELQVPVESPVGGRYFIDFGFCSVLGEFDGVRKYVDRTVAGDRSMAQVVLDEKRREDWIRARTRKRVIRWTDQEIPTPDHFLRFLRSLNITP